MIKQGAQIRAISGKGAPTVAPEFLTVCALFACGGKLAGDMGLLDTLDAAGNREHHWAIDDSIKMEIQGEQISVKVFLQRLQSEEWCKANPEHVISYLHVMRFQVLNLREQLKGRKPALKLQRAEDDGEEKHTYTAIIGQDLPQARKDELMAMYKEGA